MLGEKQQEEQDVMLRKKQQEDQLAMLSQEVILAQKEKQWVTYGERQREMQ